MDTMLRWMLDRLRPPGGWAPFLLTWLALLSPIAALMESNLKMELLGLIILTSVATIVGVRMATSRLSARVALVLGGGAGLILVLVVIGRLTPPLALLWHETGYTLDWLRLWKQGIPGWPFPFAATAEFLGQRLYELGVRLWWWHQTLMTGDVAQDTLVLVLFIALLVWSFGLFATWQLYRRRSALSGLLPSGVAATTLAFYLGRMGIFYLIVYLFCTLWLVAISDLWTQLSRWEESNTDYPDGMGFELILTATPWVVLLVAVAAFFPVIRPQQVSDAFWRVAEGPWSAVEQLSERFFGPMESGFGGARSSGSEGSLPRSHLLGAGPELTERTVLYVQTNDPKPPRPDPEEPERPVPGGPRRYWRGITYDSYTGSGWDNSPLDHHTVSGERVLDPTSPGVSVVTSGVAPGSELIQNFELVARTDSLLFMANEPVRVDRAVETWWRAPGDLAQVTADVDQYTAISYPHQPTIAELRSAPATMPQDLNERYLALPVPIPRRVLDLTAEVVAEAETDYDRAHAIEAFLRTYTYTLELPDPPTDRDLVDYFLFELQEGYCDYYASAMVVMARAAGLPARLASGYAQGTYDYDRERWVVSEKDGHSWAEVYFEGIGWVEFEPTGGQPALVRPGREEWAQFNVLPLPPRAIGSQRFPWPLLVMAAVLLLLAVAIVSVWFWRPHERRLGTAADLVRDRYGRLLLWGRRLGIPLRDGQTAHEYGVSLSVALRSRGRDARLRQVRQAGSEAPSDVSHLTEVLTRAQYSPEPLHVRDGARIHDLWRRLRRNLWWLWLGKR
jgi:transglutaminase-like putative cysteine protease